MKNLLPITKIATLALICISLASCKKDRSNASFDINNPKGYAIVMTMNRGYPEPLIAVFDSENKVTYASISTYGNSTFKVEGNDLVLNDDGEELRFTLQKDKITAHSDRLKTAVLIKIPEKNQLQDRTFTGTYYNTNGSVLHQNFFYNFDNFSNQVDVGYNVGNTVRTETYTPFGNVAAFIRNNGIEFIIQMPDGSIISNFRNGAGASYGIFK